MNFWLEESCRESARKQIDAIQASSFPNMEKEDRISLMDSLHAVLKEQETPEQKKRREEGQEKEWAEAWKKLGMRFGRIPDNKE